jgi:dihydropteroate synthase
MLDLATLAALHDAYRDQAAMPVADFALGRHQIHVFLNSFRLRKLGWPICHALPHAFTCFEEEVRTAESFFAVLALLGHASLLRTHEVAKVRGVMKAMQVGM